AGHRLRRLAVAHRRVGCSLQEILRMGPRIAATYSRISNPGDERLASLETQEEACVALAESKGYEAPEEFRFREQHSGMESIYDRAVLSRIRELVSSGKVHALACYDTDRLARDPRELLAVVGDNERHKVETLFVRLDHKTGDRVGQMILYMKGFASALEWD